MYKCPNCGCSQAWGILSCGCTWGEMAVAMRIKEAKRRRELRKQGKPVLVDNQTKI